jgi:carboxypeptidase C (cathepsin A)
MFFWFFEARINPTEAPLTLWLQGGPGMGSINQAVSGHNGPCIVQRDSNSTVINPYSWNSASNMLYIDQPVQTGFSYDAAVAGIMDMVTGSIDVTGAIQPGPTAYRGVFASQDPAKTEATSAAAAAKISEFLKLWFQE